MNEADHKCRLRIVIVFPNWVRWSCRVCGHDVIHQKLGCGIVRDTSGIWTGCIEVTGRMEADWPENTCEEFNKGENNESTLVD